MRIESVNENTCMVYFGDQIGAESAGLVKQATDRLRRDMSDLIIDLVPSYTSILVTWDLEQADRFAITRRLRSAIDSGDDGSNGDDSARIVELPVYYDPEVGLDLEDVKPLLADAMAARFDLIWEESVSDAAIAEAAMR